jgi:hypothetical protein
MTYDASDPAQVAKALKDQEDRLKDLGYILKEPRGRRWLHDLLADICHIDRLSHVPGDPNTSAFNEGARAVGLRVQDDVKTRYPAQYLKMLEENEFNG